MKRIIAILMVCLLTACASVTPTSAPPMATQRVLPAAPSLAPRTPIPPPTRAPTITPEPSNTPLQVTPDPFKQYTIPALQRRAYASGTLEDKGIWSLGDDFTRYSILYPSDGLTIYGYMNVPAGNGPFPVIIMLHGYVDPASYDTLDYTTDIANILAKAGYLILHPNLRNYRPSDNGDNLFRVGMTIDVLNLIAQVKSQGGKPGPLEKADPARIGLWGHSMGGGLALKAATISRDVKAVLLYASTSGDEQKNSQLFFNSTGSPENRQELTASPEEFQKISPASYYGSITAAVAIYHGTADDVIPIEWAQETCQQLKDAGRSVKCVYYEGAKHTFSSRYATQFWESVLGFYAASLNQ